MLIFVNMANYYFLQPPYYFVVFGLFIGITSGLAFGKILQEKTQNYFDRNKEGIILKTIIDLSNRELSMTFWGIGIGIFFFLDGGLETFYLPAWLSYLVSLFLTLFVLSLVKSQLQEVLRQLQKGGSKELDLDEF